MHLELLFFLPAVLLPIFSVLVLRSSSVSLCYFILAVPMRKCSGKHSCMSFYFPAAIPNRTYFFRDAKWSLFGPTLRLSKTKLKKVKVKSSMSRSLPCSGESTTPECGANYQLLAVIY